LRIFIFRSPHGSQTIMSSPASVALVAPHDAVGDCESPDVPRTVHKEQVEIPISRSTIGLTYRDGNDVVVLLVTNTLRHGVVFLETTGFSSIRTPRSQCGRFRRIRAFGQRKGACAAHGCAGPEIRPEWSRGRNPYRDQASFSQPMSSRCSVICMKPDGP